MFRRAALFTVLASWCWSTAAHAQTNDRYFRSWDFHTSVTGADGVGLGGAVVAMPDIAGAIAVNPALAATMRKTELFASGVSQGSGTGILGDSFSSSTSPLLIGGAALLGAHWAIGGFVGQPQYADVTLSSTTLPGGVSDAGTLRSHFTDVGGVFALRKERLQLGIGLTATHHFLEGSLIESVNGVEQSRVGTAAGETQLRVTVGGLWRPSRDIGLALSASSGNSFTASRTEAVGTTFEPATDYKVRRPASLSSGISYQLSRQVLFTGQLDYFFFSEISHDFSVVRQVSAGTSGQYEISDAFEPRAGIQVSLAPSNSLSVVLRGGVRSEPSGALNFSGSDQLEAASFPGRSSRVIVSGGASAIVRAVRIDIGVESGGDRTHIAAGAGFRF